MTATGRIAQYEILAGIGHAYLRAELDALYAGGIGVHSGDVPDCEAQGRDAIQEVSDKEEGVGGR